jgi:hypothetical protein
MRLRTLLLSGILVLGLAGPAHALDPTLTRDLSDDGKINDPCKYSAATLQASLNKVGADNDQYSPQIRTALQSALKAHASGACDPKPTATATTAPTVTATAGAATPTATPAAGTAGHTGGPPATGGGTKHVVDPPPGPQAAVTLNGDAPVAAEAASLAGAIVAKPSNDPPMVLIMLGIVLGALALGGLLVAGGRRLGFAEGPLSEARHSWREAAWRLGGNWETFRDWVRAGR